MSEELIKAVIKKRALEGGCVALLELARADGAPLPPFDAGAHVDLHITPDITRQYSLCGDPAQHASYHLGILNDPKSRGGSAAVFDSFHEGREVVISAPRNLFPLDPDAHQTLLIGGGIGVTPMIAMAYALHAQGKDFALHYCGHARATSAFIPELQAAPFAARVHMHFSDEARIDLPATLGQGHSGLHVYTCGPVGFMDKVIETAKQQGYADANIHKEYFQAEVDNSGASFEIVTAKSGKTLEVKAGESILNVLGAAGIAMKKSCEQGVCGACMVDVLEGEPEHRDKYLTDDEKADNTLIVTCCSRAKSKRLVLDI
ncbi:vanillate monooxygenase oxidoreductase subunit [Betaproteobacteria bacterium]|nr:vanillate monooxygenase oxidoreductase subunit [Betaproteobacteria bacterium]GHU06655.1 vanillate monooxygenase oxidoreductase subunit [Betaproteobacteria bacterium]GHU20908.1 vanillate monooxygenase oxidoreductase subunit [Betaproteobacteria bacterium]